MLLKCFKKLRIIITSVIVLTSNQALAQITPDATLPNNSAVRLQNNTLFIEGGTQAGSNLFHSFQEFSVPNGSTAHFQNAINIQNILTRVTGNSISDINGLIKADGTANLFLINPNGIIFGKDAKLAIGGSFFSTTANSMKFSDGFEFNAKNPQPTPLLTINVPIGLQFGSNPGDISINGSNLEVKPGKGLTLVGGNLSVNGGQLKTSGGSIELGGQTEAGNVTLGINGNNSKLGFPENIARADLLLTNNARVSVEAAGGGNIAAYARNIEITGGSTLSAGIGIDLGTTEALAGDITLNATGEIKVAGSDSGIINEVRFNSKGNGGDITIDTGSFKLEDGARLSASTFGTGNAGNVKLTVIDAISLKDGNIFSTVEEGGVGKGGNIDINAANLTLRSGAQLQTATIRANNNQPGGKGDAGNVNVNVTGLVDIAGKKDTVGSGIISSVGTAAEGNGGNITIDAGSFKLEDGARLSASTFGTGNAGNVKLTAIDAISLANNSYIFSTVEEGGVGKGGDIDINAATLSLQNGAVLLTLTREASETQPAGKGDAGNVNVKVTGAVDIAGVGDGFSSGIRSSVETGTEGNGGNIYIDADSLKLRDGAILNARTLNNNRGGNITVKTNLLEVLNGGQLITTSASGGYAGKITVEATQNVITSGSDQNYSDRVAKFPDRVFNIGASSGLFVSSTGSGIAGDIEVNSPKITLDRAGRLSAESQSGDGGNIVLNLTNLLLLRREAFISATAGTDNKGGNGGNITINAKNGFIVAGQNENTDIIANAFTGKGGQVNINARNIFNIQSRSRSDLVRENVEQLNPRNLLSNDITAISQENPNLSNEPNINTPDTDPTQGLVRLNVDIIDVARLIDENVCVRTANSSFTITGRGGIPSSPDNPAVSNFSWEDWRLSQVSQQKPMSVTTQNNPISSTSSPTSNQIIEAQGWVIDSDGTVILTAAYPASPSQNHILSQCHF